MIRLRTILLCKYPYYLFLLLALVLCFFRIHNSFDSHYSLKSTSFTGIITDIKINGDLLQLTVQDKKKESIQANYYFQTKKEKENLSSFFQLGDQLEIKGVFSRIEKGTTKNLFDYQEYMKRKQIFYSVQVESIIRLHQSTSIYYFFKNWFYQYFDTFSNGNYLKLILLGDRDGISKDIISSFRDNGISHLFAISGMHVGVLSSLIMKILSLFKVKENKRYFFTCVILILYLLLVGTTPSILRAVLFFLFFSINKVYYFYIDSISLFLLTLAITLLMNPFFLYDVGFQYSFLISFFLLTSASYLKQFHHYFSGLLATSILSFVVSVPITLYHFYQINLGGILYNLFYVPFVTFLLFPFSLLLVVCPFLEFIYSFLIQVLEASSLFLSHIHCFQFIFGRVPFVFYFIYPFLSFLFLYYKKKVFLLLFFFLFLFHYSFYSIFDTDYITMLDVGQGDSFLIHSEGKNLLIDTGGKISYSVLKWQEREKSSLVEDLTIPYLKSKGIRKIDYLILTHGDFDHLGEALTLLSKFQVDQVFINEGGQNDLEKRIIEEANTVQICKKGVDFEVGGFSFSSINHDLGDENSSSIVLYGVYGDYKMLFMGDANFKSEEYLLQTYEFDKIGLLKIGHHGSKTSSSEEFLKEIRPDIALISAGRDNKFHHPNQETLLRLKKYHIPYYSTQDYGTIEFNFTKRKVVSGW